MKQVFILLLSILFIGNTAIAQKSDKKTAPKAETKKEEPKGNKAKEEAKPKATSEKKDNEPNKHGHKADGRTKTGDPIDKSQKGPGGETVYMGSKGGKYYLDAKENKVYIKK
jgi:colicin import membrane protein